MSRDTSNDPDSEGSTGVEERLDRLESLVEQQQETIQQQRERIEELDGETDADDTPLLANRRTALKAGGLAALLFGGVGTASADPQGQVGTSSDPLKKLYTEELYTEELNGGLTGNQSLTNLTGTGLQIASESLAFDQSITPTWTGTHTYDTDGSANLNVDETGVYYSTDSSETLNIQNSGGGSVTLQEDGTPVVTESRSLTGGNAIQSLGDLSEDRTVNVDAAALAGNGLTNSNGLTGGGVPLGGSTTLDIDTGGVGSDEIGTNAVTKTELDSNSVESAQIASGAVTDTELASDSVESAQIATNAVTDTELDSDSVKSPQIDSGAVGSSELTYSQFREPTTKVLHGPLTNTVEFGDKHVVDENRPSFLEVNVKIYADNEDTNTSRTGAGLINLNLYDSNDTRKFTYDVTLSEVGLPDGLTANEIRFMTVFLEPGDAFEVENAGDPYESNRIKNIRAIIG